VDARSCISVALSRRSGYTMSLTNTDPVKTDLVRQVRMAARLHACIDFR
jgi:hypothetical protein